MDPMRVSLAHCTPTLSSATCSSTPCSFSSRSRYSRLSSESACIICSADIQQLSSSPLL